MKDFITRLSGKEVNKRTIESFIKAGALDSLGGTRRQKMMVYSDVLDEVNREKKQALTGQMSLFDFVDEEAKESFAIQYPEVGEFSSRDLLMMEKEVLGIYVSGHPLEEDQGVLKKNTNAVSSDFVVDEETGKANVMDNTRVVLGGMVAGKTIKATKTGQMMAFVTLEDMTGSVEILVFPKDYEQYRRYLNDNQKLLVSGRVSIGDDPQGKLICEKMVPFEDVPREVWIQFATKDAFQEQEQELLEVLSSWDGNDGVVVFLKDTRQYKRLPANRNVDVSGELPQLLREKYGVENVRIADKSVGLI